MIELRAIRNKWIISLSHVQPVTFKFRDYNITKSKMQLLVLKQISIKLNY